MIDRYTPNLWKVERREIGRWINRFHWKSKLWNKYMTDYNYSYNDFSKDSVMVAQHIRKMLGWEEKSTEFMLTGFYYLRRLLTSTDYKESYLGMLHLIYLDW